MAASAADLRALIAEMATAIRARTADLNALDATVGDGDHGTTVARGFSRAVEAVAAAPAGGPAEILQIAGRALLSMGGASGPLFATMFLESAKVAAAHQALTAPVIAEMLTAAANGVKARGRAEAGDKTLYDALGPAAAAAQAAADATTQVATRAAAGAVMARDASITVLLDAAVAAARAGAEATAHMVGRKGRAGFVGERSLGHLDPGAITVAVLLETIAQHCRKYGASAGAR